MIYRAALAVIGLFIWGGLYLREPRLRALIPLRGQHPLGINRRGRPLVIKGIRAAKMGAMTDGCTQRMRMKRSSKLARKAGHYDARYFEWQKSAGEFGGRADASKFSGYIRPSDTVVDLGCGGGYLLQGLHCGQRIGVEINPAARKVAAEKMAVVASLSKVKDGTVDVIISNHALEHVHDPLAAIQAAHGKLKPGGLAVFVVPCERHDRRYRADDIHRHLFTWSPSNLGNLFAEGGFKVESSLRLFSRWPPKPDLLQKALGWPIFNAICRVYGWLRADMTQVRVVARKLPLPSSAALPSA